MTRPRILIIDNNKNVLAHLAEEVKANGFSTITAQTLDEAKAVIEKKSFDVVVLDIRLRDDQDEKDLSGLMLAKSVPSGIPTIMLTSFPDPAKVREALAPRIEDTPTAFDFVEKDKADDQLVPTLRDALFVRALQNGDSKAWEKVWSREAPGVIALCRRHGLSQDQSLQVCSDTFSETAHAPAYLLKEETLRKWLINRAITKMGRVSANGRSKPKATMPKADVTGEIFINEQLLAEMAAAAVQRKIPQDKLIKQIALAIDTLDPTQKKVMMLYTFKGATRGKIAKQLGIKEKTVIKHLQDGSQLIREKIAKLRNK